MKKSVKFSIKFLFVYYILVFPVFADEANSVLQFIKNSPAPESSGLGNSYVSIQGNANSFFYNPALSTDFALKSGLYIFTPDTYSLYHKQPPLLKSVHISASYAKYYESMNYGSLFSTFALRKIGTFGIGLITLIYDDILKTEIDGNGNYVSTGNNINTGDYAILINYARQINSHLGMGINLKGIMEKLDDRDLTALAADIGALYKKGKWGIGFTVKNMGTPVKIDQTKFNLPLDFELGLHYIIKYRKFLIHPKDKILVTGNMKAGLETEFITASGMEYSFQEKVALRLGYQSAGNEKGIKAGAGIKYKNLAIDYSINFHHDLGIIHRIGLSFNFENNEFVLQSDSQGELLKESKRGREIGLQSDVLFDFDKVELRTESCDKLKQIANDLKKYTNYIIRVEGNTDDIGTEEYNLNLSKQRAYAVAACLINFGIEEEKLVIIGLGDKNPLVNNDTDENRQMNRRVDIIVMNIDRLKTIGSLINGLPKAEREEIEKLFYFGLDRYYKEDKPGALELWKQIMTENNELQKLIEEKIKKTELEN